MKVLFKKLQKVRNARRETNRSLLRSWYNINMTTSQYEFDALPSAQSCATQSLVERMIAAIPPERWVLSKIESELTSFLGLNGVLLGQH